MQHRAFDNDKYLTLQSEHIHKRIKQFGGKLYLEFGGKLFDDYHASRVLPGFEPDSKIKMLETMKDRVELVIAISANDIEKNKVRSDLGITYDQDCLRLIDAFRSIDFFVGSVVICQYAKQPAADTFKKKLENLGVSVALHYPIQGYPSNVSHIVSEEGFGLNDYIETQRELVVVTAPGPGSGKMATCLSQLYHDQKRGIQSGYAKFETFPIWNLPLKHSVNLAYEAATIDLNDVNMIDSFHLEAYGEKTVNYNRDIEVFPVLNALLEKIQGASPYKSPTDMGVNMAGYCILDDDDATTASNNEIIRRYYDARVDLRKDLIDDDSFSKIGMIMTTAKLDPADRKVVKPAIDLAESVDLPIVSLELPDGSIITGKTTSLLGAPSACLLNALKSIAEIPDKFLLIPPNILEPVQSVKTEILGGNNPRLHLDELLITLSIAAVHDETIHKALSVIKKLKNCQAHSSVMLSEIDLAVFKKLGIQITQEPIYKTKKLYHK
ncbi:MAG: DUF1846 domain-containing protein [Anaerorhabdus sp.]